jgi:ribonucleoside-triphosphate reductase
MGSPLTEERGLFAALNNCAFVSTANMWDPSGGHTPSKPFAFLMEASMLGVGVGFDTKGASGDARSFVYGPDMSKNETLLQIPDSREGWVESVRCLIDSYFLRSPTVKFDYDLIRPAGEPIKVSLSFDETLKFK